MLGTSLRGLTTELLATGARSDAVPVIGSVIPSLIWVDETPTSAACAGTAVTAKLTAASTAETDISFLSLPHQFYI